MDVSAPEGNESAFLLPFCSNWDVKSTDWMVPTVVGKGVCFGSTLF
jgi:hypothetical protein